MDAFAAKMSSCELCIRAKIFSLSFSHSYPHSLFQFLSHFKFQKFLSFHSTRFHFLSFHFYFISFHSISISIWLPLTQRAHFQFQFPFGCHFGRNSNYSIYVATVLRRILIQRSSTPRDVCPSTRASLRPHFIDCRGQSETSSSSVKTHSMSGSLRLTSQLGVHRTLSSLVLVIGQSFPPPAR